jgi:hypothetical protein
LTGLNKNKLKKQTRPHGHKLKKNMETLNEILERPNIRLKKEINTYLSGIPNRQIGKAQYDWAGNKYIYGVSLYEGSHKKKKTLQQFYFENIAELSDSDRCKGDEYFLL